MSLYTPDLDGFGQLGLDELKVRADLLDRMESKYLLRTQQAVGVLADLRRQFDLLSIDGRQTFTYETVYFDSPDLMAYRQHVQGKRRRFKIRTRRYVESDLYFFEVKLKGPRGRTVKERFPCSQRHHGQMSRPALQFIDRTFASVYGEGFDLRLTPQLAMQYRRLTLVSQGGGERVTIDYGFLFAGPASTLVSAPDDVVIVEVKSADGRSAADLVFRSHGIRPGNCSKYCVGLNLIRPDLRNNPFRRTLTEYFAWPAPPRREVAGGVHVVPVEMADERAVEALVLGADLGLLEELDTHGDGGLEPGPETVPIGRGNGDVHYAVMAGGPFCAGPEGGLAPFAG